MQNTSRLAEPQRSATFGNDLDFSDFDTPESLVEKSDGKVTMSQIRWALRFRDENGLSDSVVKFGKRLYIHRPTFMHWFSGLR